MDSRNRIAKILVAVGVVGVSGTLFYFGTGLHPTWWLTWFAPLPALLFAGRSRWAPTFFVAGFAQALGGLNVWHFLRGMIGVPLAVCLTIVILPAVTFALCVLLWRGLLLRGSIRLAAFSLPLAWTAVGYVHESLSPHSTYGNLAYSQMNFLPSIQIASWTGIWGITFVLLLVPSAAAVLVHEPRRARGLAIATLAILLASLGFGAWRTHAPMETTGTIRVQLFTNDTKGEVFADDDSRSMELLHKYSAAVETANGSAAGREKLDVILLPEKIAKFSSAASHEAREELLNIAKKRQAFVLAGFDEARDEVRRNDAVLYAPNGELVIDYEKHHFIPVLEDGYIKGHDYAVTQQPFGVWGVAICKDMDFPKMGREYAQRGVGVMLVPAWDFIVDGWYHDRMAVLRGVESGFSLVRAAKQGLLTVSDNRGRVLLEKPGSQTGIVSADFVVPVAHEPTLYARWGDWFPIFCVTGFLVCVVAVFWRNELAPVR